MVRTQLLCIVLAAILSGFAEGGQRPDDEVFDVGGGVKPPIPLVQPLPQYTEQAREARVVGLVVLQVIVRKDGSVDSFKVIRGLGYGLDESAINTIATKWRFKPGTYNGQPVDVRANIEVSFRQPSDGRVGGWIHIYDQPEKFESFDQGKYVNYEDGFKLTVPKGWTINHETRSSAGAVAAFESLRKTQAVVIFRASFSGSIQAYKDLVIAAHKKGAKNFQILNESEILTAGRKAHHMIARRELNDGSTLVHMIAIVLGKNAMTRIVATTLEPLFAGLQGTLQNVIQSYETLVRGGVPPKL